MTKKETLEKNFPLRLTNKLFDKLEKEAKKEDRSINYLINKFIEQSLGEEKQYEF